MEFIHKSIDDAILKCKPKFESMHTVKQIARYFGYKYEGIVDKEEIKNKEYVDSTKVHKFTDPKNENCSIYVSEELFDEETGNLKNSDWYNDEYLKYPEDYTDLSEEDVKRRIQEEGYPLKEFMKDYDDIPLEIKSSVDELIFSSEDDAIANGRWIATDNGKGTILLYSDALNKTGGGNEISSNARTTLFHEIGHSFAHKLGYAEKYSYDYDYNAKYLAESKDYKEGRRLDRKLTGDFYATEYGARSKSKIEEQADVTMAMLLKACNKNDPNYSNYRMALASAYTLHQSIYDEDDYLSVDDFLKRYPNRVKALNKYMNLEL